MQTKFSALIPSIIKGDGDFDNSAQDVEYFWHSFFLLKPEFLVIQNSLNANYSVLHLRSLIGKCLETISARDQSQVAKMRRANASYLLIQIFETIWPRIRVGTFGVDALNILCGLEHADDFFKNLFDCILIQRDPEPALVLLSILSATRDIETNALTDFFTQNCTQITNYCLTASDLHLLLFSLLLQLDRPSGPFIQHFKAIKEPMFNSLVANLIARSSQLYVYMKPVVKSFFQRNVSRHSAAMLGLFEPSDFPPDQIKQYFVIFEPFVDASVFCFYELASYTTDPALISAALCLFSHVETSPSTPHSGDRLRMMLISFAFLLDSSPSVVSAQFDYKQFKSCFNSNIAECRECTIGAMTLDLVSYLLSIKANVRPISELIGRILYSILFTFIQYRGNHNVNWKTLFERIFLYCRKMISETCEFNGYAMAIVSMCSSFRAALFKKDDGYINMLQALSKEPAIAACSYTIPDSLSNATDFLNKCKAHAQTLCESLSSDVGDMQDAQVEAMLPNLKVDVVNHDTFQQIEKLSECPTFTQFFHIYARQHCENTQAFLQYAASHI